MNHTGAEMIAQVRPSRRSLTSDFTGGDAAESMARSDPEPAVRTATARWTGFRSMVIGLLEPMRRGHLVIQLPEGTTIEFGRAPANDAAPLPCEIPNSARIIVRDERFFRKCVLSGDIGFGESYMDGDWDTPDLTAVIAWFLLNVENAPTVSGSARSRAAGWLFNLLRISNRVGHLLRPNSKTTARRNIGEHYDLSNRFFELMLDPSMMYSSARWTHPDQTLEEAQGEKNEALCRALKISPRDHVLEIGSGWGGWSIHAAKNYGCRITTITISEQQFSLARERILEAGVSDRVDVRLTDYRDVRERYDKVVSIEMMEALGHRYLPEFCTVVDRVLKRDGLAAFQFITCPDDRYDEIRRGVDFIQKHIFPGSLLLSFNRVNNLMAKAGGFAVRGVDDMGQDYARTLRHWRENFEQNQPEIQELGLGETFARKWLYYLGYCEAAFGLRNISVLQAVYSRANNLTA